MLGTIKNTGGGGGKRKLSLTEVVSDFMFGLS